MGALHAFFWTVGFLTIIPVPRSTHQKMPSMGWVAFWFPVAGAVIGLLMAAVLTVLSACLPVLVAAVGAVAFSVLITRALHLDGLADTLDGLFGAPDRRRRLEIMRDTHIGVFGVAGLFCILALKAAALGCLAQPVFSGLYRPESGEALALVCAVGMIPLLGRWAMILAGAVSRYAREEGTGAHFVNGLRIWHLPVASAAPAVGAGLCFGWGGVLLMSVAALIALLSATVCRRMIGGTTGDTIGATGELVEVAVALGLLVLVRQQGLASLFVLKIGA